MKVKAQGTDHSIVTRLQINKGEYMNTQMKPLVVLSLFDGMSAGRIALERAGLPVKAYYASEVDKHAIKVSKANWNDVIQIGDVTKVVYKDGVLHTENGDFNVGEIDLVIGGSPCQGFSFSGNQLNFNDERSVLFFEYLRLLDSTKPKYFLLENVSMKQEYQDIISRYLGVSPITINSSLVSAQNRKRLYWTNIPNIVQPLDKQITLESICGTNNGVWVYPRGFNKGGIQNYKGKSPCITTSSWQHNFMLALPDGSTRKFTPEEVEQFQTIPIGYTSSVSDSQRYKMLGNGWTVDVIVHILKGVISE